MSTPGNPASPSPASSQPASPISRLRLHLPTVPEALASLLSLVVVALFLNTFVLQPYLIPSESMEHTLLVGDFLLVNKQVYAPAGQPGSLSRWLMPYREVARGDIVVFHHALHPYLVKRVVGVPGDRLRIEDGRVIVNGQLIDEPMRPLSRPCQALSATTFPPKSTPIRGSILTGGGRCKPHPRRRTGGPAGEYFVLGDNRNHSDDSRFWGFVPRRPSWPGRWSSTSRSPAPPPPMSSRPRMIDSDTIGSFPQGSRGLRAGSAFSTWCIRSSGQ